MDHRLNDQSTDWLTEWYNKNEIRRKTTKRTKKCMHLFWLSRCYGSIAQCSAHKTTISFNLFSYLFFVLSFPCSLFSSNTKKKLKTNQCTFIRHRKVAFHARVFSGFFRTSIVFDHIPKSHHFIYIEISHRFHLYSKK